MNFLAELISPPRADHVDVAKYVVMLISLLVLPYISVVFGSLLFSLGFVGRGKLEKNKMFTTFGRDLADTFIGHVPASIVMGFLPIATLMICFSQMLYGTEIKIAQYFLIIFLLLIPATILAVMYRRSLAEGDAAFNKSMLLGLLALGGYKTIAFVFVSSVTLILFPENWNLIGTPVPILYDWAPVARFAHFLMASLAFTGAAILFFFLRWSGGRDGVQGEYASYVRKFGGGVALGFAILEALMWVWFVIALPNIAKSQEVFIAGGAVLLVLFIITSLLVSMLHKGTTNGITAIFLMFLVLFLGVSFDEHEARENSLFYQNYALEKIQEEIEKEVIALRAERGGGGVADIAQGEEIYNAKCIACHRFDMRIVGPPYNAVLPKYAGDIAKLKEFIYNPVKVDADYPSMPNQGLRPIEAESVAMYLLQEYEKNQAN